jgi:hypothetical protein
VVPKHEPSVPPCLIVNADDYGYFDCVSRGVLRAAQDGIVTATGVFANAPRLDEHAAWLRECEQLDVGVHLNLTDREPLTPDMARRLDPWSGRFPGKFAVAKAVLAGAFPRASVTAEWRAQIERCLALGLRLTFLNSHEHVHMLPALFRVTQELAAEYGIPHVRFAAAEMPSRPSAGGLLRAAVIGAFAIVDKRLADRPAPTFLGLDSSGRLDEASLEATIRRLQPGEVYELMCHPGFLDRAEATDPRLLGYHDWEGELAALTSSKVKALVRECGVRLVGYRHLTIAAGALAVQPAAA